MKQRLSMSLVLTLILATVDWRIGNNNLTAMLPVTAATLNCTPIGRIISVEGDRLLTPGKLLCPGDRLQATPGAKVIVLCYANGKTGNVPSGSAAGATDGCPQVLVAEIRCNPNNPQDCGKEPRGPDEVLDIISPPRRTSLLNDRPMLSWEAVKGATSYTVRVKGPEVNWESPPVQETQIPYPTDAPTLQPGRQYDLTVEADNGQSGKATFKLLSESDAKLVREIKDQITRLNLPKDEEALDLARLYMGKGLIAEAIETLVAVKDKSQTAQVYRMLGDRYLQVELPFLAKPEYETALKLATNAKDIEEQAATQYGLGAVNAALKNPDEAIRWLKAARASYETLNNIELKTDIAHFLGEIYIKLNNRDEARNWFQEALTGYETLKNPQGVEEIQKRLEQLKR
jgi:predicted negative regulator of RcsB-dependent stress response